MRKGFPKEIGMLVAEVVLPEGPAHGHIEVCFSYEKTFCCDYPNMLS